MLAKAERIRERFFNGRVVQRRQGVEQRRSRRWRDVFVNGGMETVIAAKVQTVEEQAEVRDSLKAVWCKGDNDACNCGTDNREIIRWRNGPRAARSQAREERAVKRQIHG